MRFVEGVVVEKDVMLKTLVRMTRNGVSKAFTSWASHTAVELHKNTQRRPFRLLQLQ